MKEGRPSLYTKELGDFICGEITIGKSLVLICSEESMPCPATIYAWLRTDDEFLKNYEKAKDNQADYFIEETLTIPDNEPDVQRARLKVDVRKWAASKYKPKKYGDKVQQEHSGNIGLSSIIKELDGATSGLPESQE